MSDKIFYKKRLVPDEKGLLVVTDRFVSIHETPCFHFCVPEFEKRFLPILKARGESELSRARRRKTLKRIDKRSSRIAFETEEAALEHLKFLKRKQLGHMERDTAFIKKFLSTSEMVDTNYGSVVADSQDLVREHLVFD